jgi:peptidoglycan-N-acetylglucosamine deacetylase
VRRSTERDAREMSMPSQLRYPATAIDPMVNPEMEATDGQFRSSPLPLFYERARHIVRDLWYGRTLIAGNDGGEIALTFDDGPNDVYTMQLLELLARHGIRASFFLIGDYVRARPAIARSIHSGGHLIGNHTMSHPSLRWTRVQRMREEISSCNAAIEDAIGAPVKFFRPPFGVRTPGVLKMVTDLGLFPVMWNVTGFDWNASDALTVSSGVNAAVRQNQAKKCSSNILLHDGGHERLGVDRSITVAATARLLGAWSDSAFHFVTVDAWT